MNPFGSSEGFELLGTGAAFKPELTDMIAAAQLFADFDWKDIDALSNYVQCYRIAAGTVVFKEGDAGNYLGVVIEGGIDILKEDGNGALQRIATVKCGKTVGEMSIIDGEPRSATGMAQQQSVLLLLTKDNYARIIKERPALAFNILAKLAKSMSQRLRGVSGKLVEHLGHED